MCPAGGLSRLAGATRKAARDGPAQQAHARAPAIANVPTPEVEEELPAAQQAFASLLLFNSQELRVNESCN